MSALLAGVVLVVRWSHLHAEVLSQPTASIGVIVGVLTVLTVLTWLMFALRYVRLVRIGAVLTGVAVVGDLAAYGISTREPGSAPPVAVAVVVLLAFLGIALRSVDSPRADSSDTTLAALSLVSALPFALLAYGLGFVGLWAVMVGRSPVFSGHPITAIHYGTGVLGFTVVGVLTRRSPAAYAAGTSMINSLLGLALMAALVPAMLWLARHRAATPPVEVPVEA